MSFFGGGGFPFGGFGGGSADDDEEVDNTKFYEVLQVDKNASADQIKKSYKELAKKYHPDRKGGSSQKFQQIQQAYETLGNPEKRQQYDKYGTKGPGASQDDLMNMFFNRGSGGSRGSRKESQKVKATKKGLELSLEDIYNGKVIKVQHRRTRCCQKCDGKGGQGVIKCKKCKGKGMVVQMYQMGPGMYQQVQKACEQCKGEGQIVPQGGKCKNCKGKKILEQTKTIQVPIEKGMPGDHPITMTGQGNEIPEAMAGDLIFITQEQPHEVFTRKGADLFIKKNITLLEALTGFEFTLTHLDESVHTIYTKKGQVIADKTKKVVRGLGMPFYKDPMSHGNLIIEFHVVMPKRGTLTPEQVKELIQILPGTINPRPKDDKYEMLGDFHKDEVNTSEQGGHKKQDQEEYEDEREGGSGCQAQ